MVNMINFDNAATTKISKVSLDSYIQTSECFYNPSALYAPALESAKLIDSARNVFLQGLKCRPGSTIIFTGSATESNNSVLASNITRKDKKYLIGAGEHSSIYTTAKKYLEAGYNVEFIPLNPNGSINIDELIKMLDDRVAFVSVIHVSNETGAINDLYKINKILKDYNPNILFHSDGVQALGKLDINLKSFGVDFYTLSAHKINGPKGVGALYLAYPNKYKPYLLGGEQEMQLRASTENTPGITAFATAYISLTKYDYSKHKQAILDNLTGDFWLVSDNNCVDNIISICFRDVRGETIEHMLELDGYLIGTGSACNSKAGVNRILSQIVPREYLSGAVRLSFDSSVSVEDCRDIAIKISNATKEYIKRTK